MNALVVYESMFGNTRTIAEAIADGLGHDARAVPVDAVSADQLAAADLVIVGGPTHAFGMTRPKTRAAAAQMAAQPGKSLSFEGAAGPGLREWIDRTDFTGRSAAAFDTRIRIKIPTPHAASKIARALRNRGAELVASPKSFWVDKNNRLENGQVRVAEDFGRHLAYLIPSVPRG